MGPLKPISRRSGFCILQSLRASFRKDQSLTSSLLCRKSWKLQHWVQKQSMYRSCDVPSCSFAGLPWGSFLCRMPEITATCLLLQCGQQAKCDMPVFSKTCSSTASRLVSSHGFDFRKSPRSRMSDAGHAVLFCKRSRNSIKLLVRTSVVRFHFPGS